MKKDKMHLTFHVQGQITTSPVPLCQKQQTEQQEQINSHNDGPKTDLSRLGHGMLVHSLRQPNRS